MSSVIDEKTAERLKYENICNISNEHKEHTSKIWVDEAQKEKEDFA